MDNNKRGFTLVEVLIVVGIVSFLAVITLAYFRNQIFKARDAKRKADMHLIQEAVEEYEKDNDCYPDASLVVCEPTDIGLRPYLNKIPCDPVSGDSYLYEPGGPTSCSKWYRMYAFLENQGVSVLGPGGVAYDYYVSSPNAPTPQPTSAPVSTPTSAPTLAPTSTPTPTSGNGPFWGCRNGECIPVSGPPYCSPKFGSSTCYWQCREAITGDPINECL